MLASLVLSSISKPPEDTVPGTSPSATEITQPETVASMSAWDVATPAQVPRNGEAPGSSTGPA